MEKKQALALVGDAESGTQAFPSLGDTGESGGEYWTENRPNGQVEYFFSDEEIALAANDQPSNPPENYPWDDDHIVRVQNDDSETIWN